jgi:hypothetical protein
MDDETQKKNVREKDIKKRAFSFACRIVKFYQFLAKQKGAGEVLARQILRSGTSIGANLEEAAGGRVERTSSPSATSPRKRPEKYTIGFDFSQRPELSRQKG